MRTVSIDYLNTCLTERLREQFPGATLRVSSYRASDWHLLTEVTAGDDGFSFELVNYAMQIALAAHKEFELIAPLTLVQGTSPQPEQ